ncbi:hypothetical protein [Ligilactobacillus aviarius]|uniref:hypothetical protein n=1 Tax=Ligilactobacillus aviarius TaxID=1606 RepID=UPI001F8EED8F|nr:hypothetical protein [Ligilactobacillus aviarius]HJD08622.1 hypothetical protein [Candidatus Ligilactobacillus faecavium]HLQ87453.1 hypothetical protein [Enterococcus sp.]
MSFKDIMYSIATFIASVTGVLTFWLNYQKNKRDELRQTLKIVEKDRDYWRKRAIEAEKKLAKEDEK